MKNIELINICYDFINRFITVNELIKKLSNLDTSNLSKEDIEKSKVFLENIQKLSIEHPNVMEEYLLNYIKKEKDIKERDSYDRWEAIFNYINDDEYFNSIIDNLTDYEMLEFIAKNLKAPTPPTIDEEKFNKLIKVGIEHDEREWLWRLAFNYDINNFNLNPIAEYYISKKDAYYLCELISIVGEYLNTEVKLLKNLI